MNIRIYKPLGSDGYELCHPLLGDDFEIFNDLVSGNLCARDWKPVPVEIIRNDMGAQLADADSPWLGSHALIFKWRAVEIMRSMLERNGDLLPLLCSDADLVVYNPRQVIDALDEERSNITRFDSGRIMMIRRYEFRIDAVSNVDVFKIPNLRVSPTFVSQRFVDQWKAASLKGLEFEPIWESF